MGMRFLTAVTKTFWNETVIMVAQSYKYAKSIELFSENGRRGSQRFEGFKAW